MWSCHEVKNELERKPEYQSLNTEQISWAYKWSITNTHIHTIQIGQAICFALWTTSNQYNLHTTNILTFLIEVWLPHWALEQSSRWPHTRLLCPMLLAVTNDDKCPCTILSLILRIKHGKWHSGRLYPSAWTCVTLLAVWRCVRG